MEKFNLSNLENKNFSDATNKIYQTTDYNHKQYPEYYKWFYQKSIPRVITGSGEIIFYLDALQIVGLAILKRDEDEKKICTFMISEDYRKRGYSKKLLEDSFEYLGTEKPVITIPEFRIDEFKSIIDAYDWTIDEETGIYLSKEYILNTGGNNNGKNIRCLQQSSK